MEPERISGWTVDTLRQHIIEMIIERDRRLEQRAADQDKAVSAALAAAALAVNKSEENAEKWRANANEWLTAMNDREHEFMGRREGLTVSWGYLLSIVSAAGVVIGTIALLLHH